MSVQALRIVKEEIAEAKLRADYGHAADNAIRYVLDSLEESLRGRIEAECIEIPEPESLGVCGVLSDCKDEAVLTGWIWARDEPGTKQHALDGQFTGVPTLSCAEHICRVSQNNPPGPNPITCECEECLTRDGREPDMARFDRAARIQTFVRELRKEGVLWPAPTAETKPLA